MSLYCDLLVLHNSMQDRLFHVNGLIPCASKLLMTCSSQPTCLYFWHAKIDGCDLTATEEMRAYSKDRMLFIFADSELISSCNIQNYKERMNERQKNNQVLGKQKELTILCCMNHDLMV